MNASASFTVYCHGMPGSPAELALFDLPPERRGAIFAPDRGHECPQLDLPAYLNHVHAQIERQSQGLPVRLIGFSLGARIAIELAVRLGSRAERLDLISAAAPLACGVALRDMAGGPAFALARNAPRLFGILTGTQAALARVTPAGLMRMLFATAHDSDRELVRDPRFAARMQAIIAHCLSDGATGYRREMRHYVRSWDDRIAKVRTPTTLWHGDADNWAPPAMADWLARQLPEVIALNIVPGLSHYSTLAHYLGGLAGD